MPPLFYISVKSQPHPLSWPGSILQTSPRQPIKHINPRGGKHFAVFEFKEYNLIFDGLEGNLPSRKTQKSTPTKVTKIHFCFKRKTLRIERACQRVQLLEPPFVHLDACCCLWFFVLTHKTSNNIPWFFGLKSNMTQD